ncbi:serine/threonine protein kinase [candidate division CSSED10-310 bacterium]|uniref:non-specific serine/threonine protein kinase n=1 Tax=candidate division CSSED10-310 bacterium TaxID=2855610 RepID=A0ABV6Z3E7_UNCC1
MTTSDPENTDNNQTSPKSDLPMPEAVIPDDRYGVVSVLGKGSFAETFLADDKQRGIQVAIKVFHPARIESWKSYELFEREVAILKSLNHPGIPKIYDYFEASAPTRSAYLVMEFIEGETLSQMIARKYVLDPQQSIDLFNRLLDILEYLHSRVPPVLHRDIKPANIIIRSSGLPALIDFGSVRVVFQTPDEKGSTIIGTHGYMPYEQYLGQASPSSDLYALAATFLEVLTGRPPADFLTGQGTIDVPDGLTCGAHFVAILKKMLAHAMDARFQSVSEVKKNLFAPLLNAGRVSTVPALIAENRLSIPAGPREIKGRLEPYYKKFVPAFTKYMSVGPDGDIPDKVEGGQRALVALGTIMSLGILPVAHWFSYRSLKRKYSQFFKEGSLTIGSVIKTAYGRSSETGGRAYHVLYSYEAQGKHFRGSNNLRPQMAQFWKEGTPVYILFLPQNPEQSVIIGEVTSEVSPETNPDNQNQT